MMTFSTFSQAKAIRAASLALVALAGMTGCSHRSAPQTGGTPPPSTPVANGNAQNPIANNPPPGQPNHMSPEMQAMVQHYRTVGGGGQ